jgi:hypothetical protein
LAQVGQPAAVAQWIDFAAGQKATEFLFVYCFSAILSTGAIGSNFAHVCTFMLHRTYVETPENVTSNIP